MSDLISRQAAIDAIHCDIEVKGRENAELVAKTIGSFVDRIKALPSFNCHGCIHERGAKINCFGCIRHTSEWVDNYRSEQDG